jgi:hypothetical protein
MLKTLSAALLAISVIAAPAMAAGTAKTAPIAKTTQAPAINSVKAKPAVMNANAHMGKHHHRYHARFHKHPAKHMSAKHVTGKHFAAKHRRAAHKFSKVSGKHITHAVKRG